LGHNVVMSDGLPVRTFAMRYTVEVNVN